MNLARNVTQIAAASPDRVAVIQDNRTWTYADLEELSSRLAVRLGQQCVEQGDRVALILPNCPAFVAAYLAVVRLGAVVLSVNSRLTERELRLVLAAADPRAAVGTAALLDRLPPDLVRPMAVIRLPAKPAIEDLPSPRSGERGRAALQLSPDAPAALLFSSGTTGLPKGVLLSHRNVMLNARAKAAAIGATPADRLLLFLPLFHCYGQNAVMNAGLSAGATLVILSGFDPGSTPRAVAEHGSTMFFGVPSIYRVLLDAGTDPALFASTRYFLSAGAPLPLDTARQWAERFGQPIRIAYGLTEASPFVSYNGMDTDKLGSIGAPIEGVEMAVLGADGVPTGQGSVGEIAVRGPNVMLGYWNDPAATAEVIRDGWLHTGDAGWRDEDGDYFIVDRLKDLIIVSGQNVYPGEVERILRLHPTVADAAVFGRAHRVLGEKVCAHIVARPGSRPSTIELRNFCTASLAPFKVPTEFEFVGGIPRTATGKVSKHQLRALRKRTI